MQTEETDIRRRARHNSRLSRVQPTHARHSLPLRSRAPDTARSLQPALGAEEFSDAQSYKSVTATVDQPLEQSISRQKSDLKRDESATGKTANSRSRTTSVMRRKCHRLPHAGMR